MNKLKGIGYIACSLLLLLMVACRKTDYRPSILQSAAVNYATIITTLNTLKSPAEDLYVIAGQYTEVRMGKGTKLKFYPNSFRDKSGNTIQGDTIHLSVTEMYNTGMGIANKYVHLSGNVILKNGGQIHIAADRHGAEVQPYRYGVCFFSPAHASEPMGLYYGATGYADSLVRWMRVGNMTGTAVAGTVLDTMSVLVVDSTGTRVDTTNIYRNYNEFDSCAAWGWIGCDYPYAQGSPVTDVQVVPASTAFTPANTAVFLVFPEIKAVIPLTDYNIATRTFSLQPGYEVPTGMVTHLVMVGYSGGNMYYYQKKDFKLDAGMSFTPVMTAYTATEVLNMLNLL